MQSKLATLDLPISSSKYGSRNGCAVARITPHHAAGCGTAAQIRATWEHVTASANYIIGKDGEVASCVPEEFRAYTSSNSANDSQAITIEISNAEGAGYFNDWAMSDVVFESLIQLCADICERHGIPELRWLNDSSVLDDSSRQNITVHRWFAPTACPGDWLMAHMGELAAKVNDILEGNSMTDEQFREHYEAMRKSLQAEPASSYAEDALRWCVDNGLMQGDAEGNLLPHDVLTREQMAVLLQRMAKLYGKA